MDTSKKRASILVIDDEKIIRQTFTFFLEDFNYRVLTAENGKKGIEVFEQEDVDLVLTDLRMPELNGLDVIIHIREVSPETPLIVCSGTGIIGDAVEALQKGAWGYLLKPIEDFSVMLHAVSSALEKAQLRKENKAYQQHLEGLVAERTEKLKEANRELTRHKENLEEIVKERTRELESSLENLRLAQSRLVESEKMAALGGLVAGVSHEINTPVGIGVTIASHLEERTGEILDRYKANEITTEEFEEFLSTLKESSSMLRINMDRAANLINSFKQVAVDQSSEERRPFTICKYLNEILTSMRSEYKNSGHKIEVLCSERIIVNSYPGALAQIMTNLIMNSIYHGFNQIENGHITIRVEDSGDDIRIIYRDNGKGIPKEHMKKIFEPFFTTNRSGGGSGLGLNIVYNLVTQTLHGRIECTSKLQEGTRFTIEFPRDL
ncbi:MAG: hybrid sensor histidine kinase/response regulator [Spirochaetales bacterium]|nr:hybrid sensor histidine kinase/response regulator [Spirochaetales bacterium]